MTLRRFESLLFRTLCIIVVVAWGIALNGCAAAPTHEYCSVAQPISVHCAKGDNGKLTCRKYDPDHDYLTPETERQILTHDDTYTKLCGKH